MQEAAQLSEAGGLAGQSWEGARRSGYPGRSRAVRRRLLLARLSEPHVEHQDDGGQARHRSDARSDAGARLADRMDDRKSGSERQAVTEAWFAFTTRAGKGQGIFRLEGGRCRTILTTLQSLVTASKSRSVSRVRSGRSTWPTEADRTGQKSLRPNKRRWASARNPTA